MRITSRTVTFAVDPPHLDQIAPAMTQLCGLVVRIDDSSTAIKSDLFAINAAEGASETLLDRGVLCSAF